MDNNPDHVFIEINETDWVLASISMSNPNC